MDVSRRPVCGIFGFSRLTTKVCSIDENVCLMRDRLLVLVLV